MIISFSLYIQSRKINRYRYLKNQTSIGTMDMESRGNKGILLSMIEDPGTPKNFLRMD